MTLLHLAALVWAISAAAAWEIQANSLKGRYFGFWNVITISSLMPVYNTLVVWNYLRSQLKMRKG